MSYEDGNMQSLRKFDQMELAIGQLGYDDLDISYRCPRCDGMVRHRVTTVELIVGVEIDCDNPRCRAPGERYGFQLRLSLVGEYSYLGETDRPLHEPDKDPSKDIPF